jgi:hypothetical protein
VTASFCPGSTAAEERTGRSLPGTKNGLGPEKTDGQKWDIFDMGDIGRIDPKCSGKIVVHRIHPELKPKHSQGGIGKINARPDIEDATDQLLNLSFSHVAVFLYLYRRFKSTTNLYIFHEFQPVPDRSPAHLHDYRHPAFLILYETGVIFRYTRD